ncbi:hypothetical protein C8Q78DRAFT_1153176 [Trametes maxima]|nr:hypothetical protein C8Q78DRAFT_1153176 [Trametes maxima]
MSDSSTIIIEDDSELLRRWKESDWISQNKKYPYSQTPQWSSRLANTSSLSLRSMQAFSQISLPLFYEKADTAFSVELATDDISSHHFTKRPIPPVTYLNSLKDIFGQAWFDGAQSIIDFRYKQSRLPLYVLSYWDEMARVLKQKKAWQRAETWVAEWASRQDLFMLASEVRGVMDLLPWGEDVQVLGAATQPVTLANLLSDEWLDDELIDMLFTHLSERVAQDTTSDGGTIVGTLAFLHCISAVYGRKEPSGSTAVLVQLKTCILHEGAKRLYFPANLDNRHWVAFCIDFEKKRISFGDSLVESSAGSSPATIGKIVNNLKAWAKTELGIRLENQGNVLARGTQYDGSSCGICTVNAVAHALFEDKLFTQKDRQSLRMTYFVTLGKAQLAKVQHGRDMGLAPMATVCLPAEDAPESRQVARDTDDNADEARPRKRQAREDVRTALAQSNGPANDHPTVSPITSGSSRQPSIPLRPSRQATELDKTVATRPKDNEGLTSTCLIGEHTKVAARINTKANTASKPTSFGSQRGVVGVSQSALAVQRMKKSIQAGTFKLNGKRLERFFGEISLSDHAAEVRMDDKGRMQVWHSRCAKWYTMKGPYSSMRFREHASTQCKAVHKPTGSSKTSNGPVLRTSTLFAFADKLGWEKQPKKQVEANGAVVAGQERLHVTALRYAMKNLGKHLKYKHTNKKYRNEALAELLLAHQDLDMLINPETRDEASAYMRLARGLLNGELSGYPIAAPLVKALALTMDREQRGVGRQNFEYGPTLTEFANICAITSPELYRTLSDNLSLPTIRHLKRTQNATPRFPLIVGPQTFEAVETYLKNLKYTGPVGISCDDTKLHAAFRTYWDAKKQVHMVVGGTEEPRAVADVNELQAFLSNPEHTKATKVRLWCLQIPLPKVPPIVLAARAIPNNMSADDLHEVFKPLLDGLLERNIPVRSYTCDGTETERSLQRRLVQDAPFHITYTINHPLGESYEPLVVTIAVYKGHPIVMVQDSKHALKTFRNNLFSGARLLVLGNDVAMYGFARLLAFLEDSPLYERDIEKIDRQDDNAATRLFSATALSYLTEHHPDRVAQIVYLFVMGELVDAYQNRHISHIERVKMALRARYFLDTWRAYLKAAGYSEARHFISREAFDISRILIDGLIALIIVHRDHLGNASPTPLLPWLHSSEVCEHVFAECRKLIKDFTFLDFIYLVPKLHILIRSLIHLSRGSTSDPKARAAGYAHTYFDIDGIDLAQLAIFPTDAEIDQAARDAWEETESLFSLVGVHPSDFLAPKQPAHDSGDTPKDVHLPSISSWFPTTSLPTRASSSVDHSEYDSDESEIDEWDDYEFYDSDDDDNIDEATELQNLIDEHQNSRDRNHATSEKFLSLSCAAVALSMDDSLKVQTAASQLDDDTQRKHQREDRQEIEDAFEKAAHNLLTQLPAERARLFDRPSRLAGNVDYTPEPSSPRDIEVHRLNTPSGLQGPLVYHNLAPDLLARRKGCNRRLNKRWHR